MKLLKTSCKILKVSLIAILLILSLAVAATFIFQNKIIQLTFSAINKHLATRIEVDQKVELSILQKFPEISIQLKNVRIYEPNPQSKEKLANLNKLYFTFNAFDFLKGSYVINNIYAEGGDIKISIDSLGKGNYFIFKTDSTSESNISFDLQKITLSDILLLYNNKAINQYHQVYIEKTSSSLKVKDKIWFIGLDGNLLVHSIEIEGNEYVKEKKIQIKSQQEFHEADKMYKILPSSIYVEGSEFSISGFYKKDGLIDWDIKAEKSSIASLISLLPKNAGNILNRYKSSGNIFFEAGIKGYITATQTPEVKVNFGFSNASFFHPDFDKKIEKATLSGSFSNGKHHCLRSSVLHLSNINCLFDGKNLKGNFAIENFEDPYIKFDCLGSVDLKSLLQFYPDKNISDPSGNIAIDASFSGKISDLNSKEGKEKLFGQGTIVLNDLNFHLKNHVIDYKNINGDLSFNKNDLVIRRLKGKIGKSDLEITGVFRNFINKFLIGKGELIVEGEVKSDLLELNQLLSLFSGASEQTEPAGKKYPHLEDYKFKLDCDIRNLIYHRLHARNIKGEFEFDQPGAFLKNFSFNTAGGKISLSSLIYFKTKDIIELNTKATLTNIFIDSVFYISENFNQDFIQDKNLKGQFTGSIRLFFAINNTMEIHPSTVIATIDASITNGELNNFEPMKKLSRFVDVKELDNIKFSELKNKIYIENRKVVIPEMEIKSNASNISIMGTHTFDQEMDYKLKVPLKNFKKKPDKDEAFGAIEEDNKGNSVLFLTIKGTTDKYKIAYDTKRTGQKIKEDLKKEKKELENIFKKKKEEQAEQFVNPDDTKFFDF